MHACKQVSYSFRVAASCYDCRLALRLAHDGWVGDNNAHFIRNLRYTHAACVFVRLS